jgi:hypothetical protein
MSRSPSHLTDQTLQLLLDDALSPAEAEAARTHLDHCVACSNRLDVQARLFASIESWPAVAAPADLERRVMEALPVAPPVGFRMATALQAGLVVVIAAVAWPLIRPLASGISWPSVPVMPTGIVEAGVGGVMATIDQGIAFGGELWRFGATMLQGIPIPSATGALIITGAVVIALVANSILLGGRSSAGARRLP